MKLQNVLPADIEKRSMEIIGEELGELKIDPEKISIVKRVIHTSADFDYARNMRFSEGVVEKALEALKNGATIITDTNMACTGINKAGLAKLGAKAVCFMADADVAARAKEAGSTRAAACMEKACTVEGPVIIAVGNAPTALVRLDELVKEGKIKRTNKVRLIRDGIVIYTGELGSLKRFKDDVKEVKAGYECGFVFANFNDIKEGDLVEAFKMVEVPR